MKRLRIIMLLVLSSLGIATAQAQDKASVSNSIANQFEYILMKSENYRDLKIVKRKWIESLQRDVLGYMSKIESELNNSKSVMSKQKNQINTLQSKLQETSATLSTYTNSGPKVTFFGFQFDQKVFATTFALLFFGAVISVLIFALRYKKSNAATAHSKSVLADLEDEYQEYKRKAIEREQKISRLLQDEINRQKKINTMNASS